jgi:hypothetical protein
MAPDHDGANPAGRHRGTAGSLERAAENRAYLHTLLLEREPGFAAAVELAITLVDRELSGEIREACAASDIRNRLELQVSQAVAAAPGSLVMAGGH